jgi:hypothetical protein
MPLLDVADLKSYLRIEHDVDDGLLARLLASAEAAIAAHVDRPLGADEQTVVLEAPDAVSRGLARDGARARTTLRLPVTPVAPDPAPVVIDGEGRTLSVGTGAGADLRLTAATGLLTSATGAALDRFPYTVTAYVGLGTRRDYGAVVQPALAQAACDLVADWYQRRNPAAAAEGAGGGVYTQYAQGQLGIPARILEQLAPFRRVTL